MTDLGIEGDTTVDLTNSTEYIQVKVLNNIVSYNHSDNLENEHIIETHNITEHEL